jgi:predicted PhzF superfamily epimerase YddE/YHI9
MPFTDEPFKGNSAAVCLLVLEDDAGAAGERLDGRWMQAVAAEFNTPITAFLVRGDGSGGRHGCCRGWCYDCDSPVPYPLVHSSS